MPQSFAQIYLHIVFSTKSRQRFLIADQLREQLHAYIVGICKCQDSPALVVGGTEDHIHLLCCLDRQKTVANLIRDVKSGSSKWIKQQNKNLHDFEWQAGYGAFSISPSHLETLKRYIANQMEHHHKESFQDELRRLFQKYNVDFDERYVWD